MVKGKLTWFVEHLEILISPHLSMLHTDKHKSSSADYYKEENIEWLIMMEKAFIEAWHFCDFPDAEEICSLEQGMGCYRRAQTKCDVWCCLFRVIQITLKIP